MNAKAEPWTPPTDNDVQLQPVGKAWDAVRASVRIGDCALKYLGQESGAVIQDWTTRPGTHWRIPVGPNRYLTDAAMLHRALTLATIAELGPAEEAPR